MQRRRRVALAWLFRWHRTVGLTAAAFVVILAVTGIALNHTGALRLDERHVTLGPLLDWYGVGPPSPAVSFDAAGQRITRVGERLYLDAEPLRGRYTSLVGAVSVEGTLLIAAGGEIQLLTPEGRLIERLGASEGVPAAMEAVGTTDDGRVAVRAAHGLYVTAPPFLEWSHPEDPPSVDWAQPRPLPDALEARLLSRYRGQGLSLERVLLDLHSGRILGGWGVWLVDALAVLFTFLAATGFLMWWKTRRAHRGGRGSDG